MGTKERRDRQKQATRQRILDAARELFVKEGYEAVTMRKLAAAIEYSPTAIYFHFADKETLFRELCVQDFLAISHEFFPLATIADPVARMRQLGQVYVRFALAYPNHYRLMFMTPHPPIDSEQVGCHLGNPRDDGYAFLKLTVEEAMRQGRLRPELTDAEELVQLLWGSLHGIIALQIIKGQDTVVPWRPLEALAERLMDIHLRALLREEA
ncbi:MAG: TetR/AcrR family transcriptional regulator [Deltaproteobacteria bacterium]|nr:TetR/AcrR family transcriptional regulator [Deltaproteobacteria bacterium]